MKNIVKRYAHFTQSYLFRIIVCCALMMAVILASGTILYQYYYRNSTDELYKNYKKTLSTVSKMVDDLFYNVVQYSYMITENESMESLLMGQNTSISKAMPQVNRAIRDMGKYKLLHDGFIEEIIVIDSGNNMVISNEGSYQLDTYFDYIAFSETCGKSFWQAADNTRYRQFSMLSHTVLENKITGEQKEVIPIVFYKNTKYTFKNPLVIHISVGELQEVLEKSALSAHAEMMIYNTNGEVYAGGEDAEESVRHYMALAENHPQEDVYREKNEIVMLHKNSRGLFENLNYMVIVPKQDITDKMTPLVRLYYISMIICAALVLAVSLYLSKSIYRPIKKLVGFFSGKGEAEAKRYKNEFDMIEYNIQSMIYNNVTLRTELSSVLPVAGERLFLKLLTQKDEYLAEDELSELLQKYDIHFRYDCYIAAIVNISYTDLFYEDFSPETRKILYESIVPLLVSFVPEDITLYTLEMEQNQICLIFNVPDASCQSLAYHVMESFQKSFCYDENLISILIGIGSCCEGFLNLKHSFWEAVKASSVLSAYSAEKIMVYSEDMTQSFAEFTGNEENRLFNYLVAGRGEEAMQLLDEIKRKNVVRNLPKAELVQLFLKLYRTAERVMRTKNITIEEVMPETGAANPQEMPPEELDRFVTRLFESLAKQSASGSKKEVMHEIVAYVENNYQNDIYLDFVADRFNLSPKYLSRAFKKYTNVRFVDYLNEIRISHAKELLNTTDETIMDIAKQVGFNSRNTFYRVFKNSQGVTPAEYRSKNE